MCVCLNGFLTDSIYSNNLFIYSYCCTVLVSAPLTITSLVGEVNLNSTASDDRAPLPLSFSSNRIQDSSESFVELPVQQMA